MSPDAPLRGLPLAVVDVESTGTDPATAHVVEVAVAHTRLGDAAAGLAFRTLVRPPVPIPPESTAVHGIRDADVVDAPTWEEARAEVAGACEGRVVVAYNVPYDSRMVCTGITWREEASTWLCLLNVAKYAHRFAKGAGRHKLAVILKHYGIEVNAHGAGADALATALLCDPLMRDLYREARTTKASGDMGAACRAILSVTTYRGLLEWQRTAALAAEREWAARANGQAFDYPWHALYGVKPPEAAPKDARPRTCGCGAAVVYAVAGNGEPVVLDAEQVAIIPAGGRTAEERAALADCEFVRGWNGASSTVGWIAPPELAPTLGRVKVRRPHRHGEDP